VLAGNPDHAAIVCARTPPALASETSPFGAEVRDGGGAGAPVGAMKLRSLGIVMLGAPLLAPD
jgi:hypothetical protein